MSLRGWEGAIRVADSEAGLATASNEPKVQSASISHGGAVEPVYEIGSRRATELKEGNIEITVSLEVLYRTDTPWPSRCGVGATGALTTYYLGIYPKGYATGNPKIVIEGKFTSWSYGMTQDGLETESIEFVGRVISVGTI